MQKRDLEIGDVVQLNPCIEKFGGMLVVVTEPKSWGCQGYLVSCHNFEAVKYKGRAFVRPRFEDMEFVGKVVWIEEDKKE